MMTLPNKKDAVHKAWLYRLLEAIADDSKLSEVLYFKGGTCAAMLDWLNRFSVDLDFDYSGKQEKIPETRKQLEIVFKNCGLAIKDSSKNGLQYFLKYDNIGRNTLKIEASFPLFASSQYEPQRFIEIDRILTCQTKETLFAHKLVALIDRFEKTNHIAGRDVFDIHSFFLQGFNYNKAVIEERRKVSAKIFFIGLIEFTESHVTDKIITEDLSFLLPPDKFAQIRKSLKREVLSLLRDEIAALK